MRYSNRRAQNRRGNHFFGKPQRIKMFFDRILAAISRGTSWVLKKIGIGSEPGKLNFLFDISLFVNKIRPLGGICSDF